MRLKEFFVTAKICPKLFAQLVNVSHRYLMTISNEKARISWELAERIEKATNNVVTVEELPTTKSRYKRYLRKIIHSPDYILVDPFNGNIIGSETVHASSKIDCDC